MAHTDAYAETNLQKITCATDVNGYFFFYFGTPPHAVQFRHWPINCGGGVVAFLSFIELAAFSCDFFESAVLSAIAFEPTQSQLRAIHALSRLVCSEKQNAALITTLMRSFCEAASAVGLPVVLLAPTGRAAKVLSGYTCRKASTIHRVIYRQDAGNGLSFDLSYNKFRDAIFIVDEASMIGDEVVAATSGGGPRWGDGRLLRDLIEFVFSQSGCRLVLVGDPDQLPPVGLVSAPALNVDYLKGYGLIVGCVWLSDVVRQSGESLILKNSMSLRALIEADAPTVELLPPIEAKEGSDVECVSGVGLLERIEDAFGRCGMTDTVIITRSNRRATQYSIALRAQALYMEEKLSKGDLLIVTRNNYLWAEKAGVDFIANGDIAEVVSINGYSEMSGLHFADVSIRLVDRGDVDIDCQIVLDFLTADVSVPDEETRLPVEITTAEISKRIEAMAEADYGNYSNKAKRMSDIRKDPWINALQVRYAYAMTCHKAQGGQWDTVFVDVGYVDETQSSNSMAKWLYTAMTRARKKLYLVNYPHQE